jgi:uncharacterized protein (DUF2345 family)
MLAITPLRIYNTNERHWRQYSPETPRRPIIVKAASHVKAGKLKAEVEIEQLKLELKKHKEAEQKIKRHAKWMLRSTQSAHKDATDVIEIIKDLYGDDAFE